MEKMYLRYFPREFLINAPLNLNIERVQGKSEPLIVISMHQNDDI